MWPVVIKWEWSDDGKSNYSTTVYRNVDNMLEALKYAGLEVYAKTLHGATCLGCLVSALKIDEIENLKQKGVL